MGDFFDSMDNGLDGLDMGLDGTDSLDGGMDEINSASSSLTFGGMYTEEELADDIDFYTHMADSYRQDGMNRTADTYLDKAEAAAEKMDQLDE